MWYYLILSRIFQDVVRVSDFESECWKRDKNRSCNSTSNFWRKKRDPVIVPLELLKKKIDPEIVPRIFVLMNNLVFSLCDSDTVPLPIRSNLTIEKTCYFSQSGPKKILIFWTIPKVSTCVTISFDKICVFWGNISNF